MKIIVCNTCDNSLDESDTIDGRCKTHIVEEDEEIDDNLTAKADTIADNLTQLLELASEVADNGLKVELHRIYIDLREGVADIGVKCDCGKEKM